MLNPTYNRPSWLGEPRASQVHQAPLQLHQLMVQWPLPRNASQAARHRPVDVSGLRCRNTQPYGWQTVPTSRAASGARGRAVAPRAQSGSHAPQTAQSDSQDGTAVRLTARQAEDLLGKRACRHISSMRHEADLDYALGIWSVQAQIRDMIVGEGAAEDGDGGGKFCLRPAQTALTTQENGNAFFPGNDGLSFFDIEVHEGFGSKLAWLATPRSVVVSPFSKSPPESVGGKFALGGRVNAYVSSSHTYAPNFDMELYHWPGFDSLFVYLNLVPRRSLFQFPDDVDRIYQTRHPGCSDTYQDLFKRCEERCKTSGWQQYTSPDPYVRALTGSTALMYKVPVNRDNLAEIQRLSLAVHAIWDALMGDGVMPRPGSGSGASQPDSQTASHREYEQAALEQTDRQLLGWAARDPDAKLAERLVGPEGFQQMMALLTRDREDSTGWPV